MILKFIEFINESEKRDDARLRYSIKPEGKIITKEDLNNYEIPSKIKEMMMNWDIIYKSPYSNSFYSSTDISWTHKPDGSYRVANHWNFVTSKGPKKHCVTDIKVQNTTHISIGRFSKEKRGYEILLSEPTETYLNKVRHNDIKLKYLKDPETIYKKKLFKQNYLNNEILVDFNYDDVEYNGILKNWTGSKIKIEDSKGEVIFNNTGVGKEGLNYKKIKNLKFTNKHGHEISDPYQNDPC